MSSVMVYDLLLVGPRTPEDLTLALADVFSLTPTEVDVAYEDADDRNWRALVLATYGERHGDVALSLSITSITTVLDAGPQLTEAALAARLAINDGVDPTGAKVAAVLIKNNPEKWDHGVPIGPCDSCKHLVDHFDLDFVE
jgi:hypothetical protein